MLGDHQAQRAMDHEAVTAETPAATPRQLQVVDLLQKLGSKEAVAKELGIARITVDVTLSTYHQRVCGPRIAALEAELEKLRILTSIEHAAQHLDAVVGRIERAVTPVSHRRIADGGTHARHERRERIRGCAEVLS